MLITMINKLIRNVIINDDYSNILLKPGLGFGTGKHPTTKLCLKELQKIDNKVV